MQQAVDAIRNGASKRFGRRAMLKGGAAGAAGLAFTSLASTPAGANQRAARPGDLRPVADSVTGLELLELPEGFHYQSFGWTGQIMGDGRPTPTDHDGMAVVAQRGQRISMVRNHENSEGEGPQCFVEGGMYNPAQFGGTTNLVFNLRREKFVRDFTTLGGTIRNCAGGWTPWRSWISCEETFHPWGEGPQGFNHGYIFDCPAWRPGNGQPIRSAGRFSHEAVAVDPWTGIVYETEDARPAGLYAYHNPGRHRRLEDGGELYALAIKGEPDADLTGSFPMGTTWEIDWIKVEDPEGVEGRPFDSAPGRAIFSRLEGIWFDEGRTGDMYFVSTDGGDARLGQVYKLDAYRKKLELVYESTDAGVLDGPDNIATDHSGNILLCEDGDSDPKRLIGLNLRGEIFEFARNVIDLKPGDIDTIDAIYPGTKANFWDDAVGDYSSREWAGATFYGEWLFVNVQSPGVTFAITGPWAQAGFIG